MQNSLIPISLYQFNQILEKSSSTSSLRNAFSFAEKHYKNGFNLGTFIESTKFLIESYPDLNMKDFRLCIKMIKQLFPNATPLESKIALLFQTKINTYFYYRFTSEFRLNISPAVSKEQMHLNALCDDKQLESATEIFQMTAEERLAEAYQIESASHDMQKGFICQLILNMLILEADLVQVMHQFMEAFTKYDTLNQRTMQGCSRILRLDAFNEKRLYEIPANLENSDMFAFWLNLSAYIELSEEKNHLYASLNDLNTADLYTTKERLNLLAKTAPSNEIKHIISIQLDSIERFFSGKSLYKINKRVNLFLSEAIHTGLAKKTYSNQLEYVITPCSYWLFSVVRGLFINIYSSSPREIPKEEIRKINKALIFFSTIKQQQSALFSSTLNSLNALISKHPKQKREYLAFRKSLIQNACLPLAPLRKYPTETSAQEPASLAPPQKSCKGKAPATPLQTKTLKTIKTHEKLAIAEPRIVPLKTASRPAEATIFPYKYSVRVWRWRTVPLHTPLPKETFPEYADKPLDYQILMHLFHSLDFADDFIARGIQGQWRNVRRGKDDLRIAIPAEIIFKAQKFRGLITYAIDTQTATCYHCCFSTRIDQEILAIAVSKIFNENDFPELQISATYSRSSQKYTPLKNRAAAISEDHITGNVHIEDFERGFSLKLFNTQ